MQKLTRILRDPKQVFCEAVEKEQAELLGSLLKGEPLGETCARVAGSTHTEELPLEQWFSLWTGQGLIARVA